MQNFLKKIIIIFSLVFSFNVFFSSVSMATENSPVVKQNVADQAKEDKDFAKTLKTYQSIWQAMYTLTWPILVVAWQFMDNAVVYGSFIWMDTLLWKIWNMMRMFANYIIWFVLIFSIFTLFMWSKLQNFHPVKVLPQIVVASFLVNASWFIMWALIDAANIMTYSVGTLPMKMAKIDNWEWKWQAQSLDDIKIPTTVISFQQNDANAFNVWIKDWDKILPFCELVSTKPNEFKATNIKEGSACVFQNMWKYYKISNAKSFSLDNLSDEMEGTKFSEARKELGWMTAVLTTLYASLIDIWKTVSYPSWWNSAMASDVVLKLIFLVALLIPLLTLAIVLIVRAVMLWFYIILSPLIFLFTPLKWFWKLLWEKWQLSAVCCLIFLPVIVVFALSISFVFLSYLKFSSESLESVFNISSEKWSSSINIKLSDNPNVNDSIKMTYKWTEAAWTSLFWNLWTAILRIIQNIFAISFMWVIVFSALKSCKVTWWIVKSIETFAIWMWKATPIMPIPGAWAQSRSSLWLGAKALQQRPSSIQQSQYNDTLSPLIEEIQRSASWAEKKNIKSAWANIQHIKPAPINSSSISNISSSWLKPANTAKISETLNNTSALKNLASAMKVGEKELKESLESAVKKDANITWKDYEKFVLDESKNIMTNYINDNFINKQITLWQLPPEQQSDLISKFKSIFPNETKNLSPSMLLLDPNQETALIVFLWEFLKYSKEDIIKLISADLRWSKAIDFDAQLRKINSILK